MTLEFIIKLYSIILTLTIMTDSSNSAVSDTSSYALSIKKVKVQDDKEIVPESSVNVCELPKYEAVTEKEKECISNREERFVSRMESSKLAVSWSNKDDCQLFNDREKVLGSSSTETSGLSTCGKATKENVEILYDREKFRYESLNKNLMLLMTKALKRMKEIEPVIDYFEKKIQEYQKSRKYDKVSLVGSLGNKLYFPELMPDGTYQVESDILYERSIHSLSIPVTNEDTQPEPVIAVLEIDTLNETLPQGTVLLKVKDVVGDLDDTERTSFFKQMDESDSIYFRSSSFRMSVPHMYSSSILGEKEITTFGVPILQPLYRTFKTNRKILTTNEREITFVILMDKVASIKVSWLDIAEEFKTRKRIWPSERVINKVVTEGCSLIHKPANEAKTYMLEWRLTFAISEQLIVSSFTEQQRALFVLIKQMKRKYLDMGTFESGEAKMGLTTYHLKTVMLWLSESISPKNWTKSPLECFISFMKQLEKCLHENFLAHYFIPDINILEGAWSHKHLQLDESKWLNQNKPMRLILLEKIQEILHHPEDFLVQDILWATDKKHAHESEKIPVVENIFGDLLHSMVDKELGVRNELNLDVEKIKELVNSLNKDDQDETEDINNETQNEKKNNNEQGEREIQENDD